MVDLRLLGQQEKDTRIEETSGAKLIKAIRTKNQYVPIILVSATDRIKSLELLQKYPYNIDDIWRKPRVDRNKLNLYEIYAELLSKITRSLKDQTQLIRLQRKCDYFIEKERVEKSKLPEYCNKANLVFYDTNFFLQNDDKSYIDNQVLFHLLCSEKGIKNVIIADVWQELFFKKSTRNLNIKAIDSINRILKLLNSNKISSEYRDLNRQLESTLQVSTVKENGTPGNVNVKLTQSINKSIDLTQKEAENKEKDLKTKIENNKISTLVHADDQFRLLFRYYAMGEENKVIIFFNNDKALNCEIIKELIRVSPANQINLKINNGNEENIKQVNIPAINQLNTDLTIKSNKLHLQIIRTQNP